jgi:anionic cell wall polymer biosynthesis LytR-Cps2A-Psr (LCP) family protein
MSDKNFDPALIFVGIIVALVLGLGIFLVVQFRTDEVSARLDTGKVVPVLLVVTDQGAPILSQVVLVQPKTKRIALIDIPDNLGAIFGSLSRVDSYEMLYKEKGIDEYRSSISRMLDHAVDFHVVMSRAQMVTLVDLLDGVPVSLADPIDHSKDGDFIRVPNGNDVVLDGEKALALISYRDTNEHGQELSTRKWSFTKALLGRFGAAAKPLQDSQRFTRLMLGQFSTNMDEKAVQVFCRMLEKVDTNSMVTQRIIGTVRPVDTAEGQKSLLFPHFEGQLVKDSIRQVLANLDSAEDPKDGQGMIRIEILNGTTVSGLAKKTKELFQSYGFEVVNMGNAPVTDMQNTMVIDRKGNPALAERTAKIIKCDRVSAQIEASTGQDIDVTVMLGKDFDGWTVKRN